MELFEVYLTCRSRLLDLAPTLSAPQLGAPLSATPPWVVADGYRHVTGVCADVLDGALEGAGSPAWTAAQLAARAGRSIDDICGEWAERGPQLDARVRDAGTAMAFVVFDAWTHEQDIRAGAGRAGGRDELAVTLAPLAAAAFNERYTTNGGVPLAVVMDGREHVLGSGAPVARLDTSPYELMRMIFGRRSRAQVEAAGWSGDAGPAIGAISLFDFPVRAIDD